MVYMLHYRMTIMRKKLIYTDAAPFVVVARPAVLLLSAVDAACAPAGAVPLHDPLEGELPL